MLPTLSGRSTVSYTHLDVYKRQVPISEYTDGFGNRCVRLLAPAGPIRFWNDAVVEDSGQPDYQNPAAEQHEIYDLPDATLTFLMPSRYCEAVSYTHLDVYKRQLQR